jgi:hypothetical protein
MEIKYHQHIGIYKNAVSDELCDSLINLYEKYPNGHEKRNRNQPERDNFLFIEKVLRKDIIPIPENEKNSIIKIVNSFNKSLKDTLDSYTYKYPDLTNYGNLIPDMGTKIQKTKPGEGYHSFHCEQHYDDLLLFSRVLVFTLYLNNVEEAGETEFLHQLIRVKPTKGTICLFPAGFTHPHRGNTPYSEEKYILTGWLCCQKILEEYGNKLRYR